MRFPFGRKQNRFYELLSQQAEKTKDGMEALLEYVTQPSDERARMVSVLEGEADEIADRLAGIIKSMNIAAG